MSGEEEVRCQVKRPTSAQVMIVLTAQSLKPALDSVSPSLSAPPPLIPCLSLQNKH